MGNQEMCCLTRDKEHLPLHNILVIFREYMDVKITVKLGDIKKENGQCVICLYSNPDKISLQQSIVTQVYDDLCKIGFESIYNQPLQIGNFKMITYYRVKEYHGEKDLFQYYNGFKECLQFLNDEQNNTIYICDCPIKNNRSFGAEVLIRSVIDFIEEQSNRLNVKNITIMNCDCQSSRFLKYELIKQIEQAKQPTLRKDRQSKFLKFITSTKSITSEMGRQNKCDFSLTDFDLGDESKLINASKQIQEE